MDSVLMKYRAYLLHQLLNGVDDMIDQRPMTLDEFVRRIIEQKSQTCNNKENKHV